MPTYNNPDTYGTFGQLLQKTFYRSLNSDDYILKVSGTKIDIYWTRFAEAGFGIHFELTAPTTPSSNFHTKCSGNSGFPSQSTSPVITGDNGVTMNSMEFLSYRRRYLRTSNGLTCFCCIHPNEGNSQKTIINGLNMYHINIADIRDKSGLDTTNIPPIKNCFSIVTDEWVFYDNPDLTLDGDETEYPCFKDENNRYFTRDEEDDSLIIKSFLKINGAHYLFNNENKLQERDFNNLGYHLHSEISGTQNYSDIGENNSQEYKLQNKTSSIMHKKANYNIINRIDNAFHYYNNDYATNLMYYTDLGDNNAPPEETNPYVIYDNRENHSAVVPTALGVDQYTFYCNEKLYFIPSNGIVDYFKMSPGSITNVHVYNINEERDTSYFSPNLEFIQDYVSQPRVYCEVRNGASATTKIEVQSNNPTSTLYELKRANNKVDRSSSLVQYTKPWKMLFKIPKQGQQSVSASHIAALRGDSDITYSNGDIFGSVQYNGTKSFVSQLPYDNTNQYEIINGLTNNSVAYYNGARSKLYLRDSSAQTILSFQFCIANAMGFIDNNKSIDEYQPIEDYPPEDRPDYGYGQLSSPGNPNYKMPYYYSLIDENNVGTFLGVEVKGDITPIYRITTFDPDYNISINVSPRIEGRKVKVTITNNSSISIKTISIEGVTLYGTSVDYEVVIQPNASRTYSSNDQLTESLLKRLFSNKTVTINYTVGTSVIRTATGQFPSY